MKVLIVDDELVIRKGLKNKIERLISDLTSVILAEDAFLALEIMKAEQPDVVITDIRMPEMDGLAFIEQAKKISKKTKYIIISGYQEFEYAKEAIKLNVEDYLIKPIENAKLLSVMQRIQDKLMEESEQKQQLNELKTSMKQTMSFLRSKHLTDLLEESQNYDFNAYQLLLNKVEIRFPYPCFTIITIELNPEAKIPHFNNKEDLPLVKFIINNIAEEIMNDIGKCIAFEDNKNKNLLHLIFNHPVFVDKKKNTTIYDHCNKLLEEIHQCLKIYVTIGIGNKVDSFQALNQSYLEATRALKQKFITNDTRIFCSKKEMISIESPYLLTEEKEKTVIQFIRSADSISAQKIIEDIFNNIELIGIQYSNLIMLYMDIMLMMIKAIKDQGICFDDIFEKEILSEDYISTLSNVNELKNQILNHIDRICNYLMNTRKSDGEKTIESLKNYIQQYYYLDLNLSQLSQFYFMNSNYLSQLFKKETGQGFLEYLTQIRMEQAKKLLINTQFKAYEISEMVGYNNPKYFSRAFYKYCGCTPTQFRNLIEE